MSIEITKKKLYVGKMINVISSYLNHSGRTLVSKGRHSDAFVYILSGSCNYFFEDGVEFTANGGNILYLAKNAVYDMYVISEEYRFIFCDFEFICDEPRKSELFFPSDIAGSEEHFRRLYRIYNSDSATAFNDSMSLLYTVYSSIISSSNKTYVSKGAKDLIESSREYIDRNFADASISISLLAERVGISEVYYRRIFKSMYGVTPIEYIVSVRLKRAKELMEYSFLSIEECALQSGFSSPQYFSRVFKCHEGVTPGQYRKKK